MKKPEVGLLRAKVSYSIERFTHILAELQQLHADLQKFEQDPLRYRCGCESCVAHAADLNSTIDKIDKVD